MYGTLGIVAIVDAFVHIQEVSEAPDRLWFVLVGNPRNDLRVLVVKPFNFDPRLVLDDIFAFEGVIRSIFGRIGPNQAFYGDRRKN